jgi:hypothetical protein
MDQISKGELEYEITRLKDLQHIDARTAYYLLLAVMQYEFPETIGKDNNESNNMDQRARSN